MPAKTSKTCVADGTGLPAGVSPCDAALYTKELVDSLREMALAQSQLRLADLLAAAAAEAQHIATALLAGPQTHIR